MLFDWYEGGYKASKKHLSQDLTKAQDRERNVLAPMKATIALLFGNKDGTIRSIHNGTVKLAAGQRIECGTCGQYIHTDGHSRECQIMLRYNKVMARVEPEEMEGINY